MNNGRAVSPEVQNVQPLEGLRGDLRGMRRAVGFEGDQYAMATAHLFARGGRYNSDPDQQLRYCLT